MKRGPLTILSAAAILCVGTRALGQDARWLPPAEEHRLASGLTVVLAPDEALDDVTVLVRYAAGSADDPKGKDGLAHLTEHMMYAGSKHVPPGDYWRWIARARGWNLNGQTYLDGTSYFVTVPPEELPVIFWLESDRMAFQIEALDAAKVDRERALVLDEMRDKLGDQGLGMFDKTGYNEVFPVWHPYYRVPDLRWVEGLELEDVRAFLRTWYTPRNATLIVVGRFDAKPTLELAERYFGDLRGAEPPVRPVLRARWRIPDVHVEMRGAMPRSAVTMTWWSPPFGTGEDAGRGDPLGAGGAPAAGAPEHGPGDPGDCAADVGRAWVGLRRVRDRCRSGGARRSGRVPRTRRRRRDPRGDPRGVRSGTERADREAHPAPGDVYRARELARRCSLGARKMGSGSVLGHRADGGGARRGTGARAGSSSGGRAPS